MECSPEVLIARVARGEPDVVFYVRTREAITPHDGPRWVLLFVDAGTGRSGYDDLVNPGPSGPGVAAGAAGTQK